SASRADSVLDEMSSIFRENYPEVRNISLISGLNLLNRSFKASGGTFFVQLQPWAERSRSVHEVIADLEQRFYNYPHATMLAVSPAPIPGLGLSGGFSMQIQEQQAGDIKQFEQVIQRFVQAANQRPEVAMAYTLFNSETPNYELEVDREQAKRMGVNVASVYSTVSTYIGSSYVNDFTRYGRNYRVVTQADTNYRKHIEDIGNLYVKNVRGESVPLSSLVSYRLIENPSIISHFNIFRAIEVSGRAAPGYSSGDALRALEEVAAQVLPAGYAYDYAGLSRQEKESGSQTIIIFALSILFVFLLLASLYESWSVPFSILLSVPIGIFGAILVLMFLPHFDYNVYASIGLVAIFGLAAKNAILIVEFAKERVDMGMP